MGEERIGDWMQTYTGKRFYPFDPRACEIDIVDIGHALANLCRFGGHCREFYSVAEHSVRVSRECAPEDALWGLLHDASEAYLCDLPRPIKRSAELRGYSLVEKDVQRAVHIRFGLLREPVAWEMFPSSVYRADEVLLATEARDLMGNHCLERWSSLEGIEPLPERIEPWPWREARDRFLQRFYELTKGDGNGR